jgi:hypothetical protein
MTVPSERPTGLHLVLRGEPLTVKIGPVDVSAALVGGDVSNAEKSLAKATLRLDSRHWTMRRIDWHDQVVVTQGSHPDAIPLMMGDVREARLEGHAVLVDCTSAATLNERALGHLTHSSNCELDLIYSLFRTGGIPRDRIAMETSATLRPEIFEIAVPVRYVAVEEHFYIGKAVIVPQTSLSLPTQVFDHQGDFPSTQAVAVTYVHADRMFDAQEHGLQVIRDALDWLETRRHYSFAVLPNGQPNEWTRPSSQRPPAIGSSVMVRGVVTLRWWIRDIIDENRPTLIELNRSARQLRTPRLPERLPQNLQQAIAACSRASQATSDVGCATALWEALEFYCAATPVPAMFSKGDRRALKKAIGELFTDQRKERIGGILQRLNEPPTLARLRQRIALDGAPISEQDFALLASLRRVRNDAVHGRETNDGLTEEDLRLAVSICARLLVHRVAAIREHD